MLWLILSDTKLKERKDRRKEKKICSWLPKCLPPSFFLTNAWSAAINMCATEEGNTESLKLSVVLSHHTKLAAVGIRVEGHSGDVPLCYLDSSCLFKGSEEVEAIGNRALPFNSYCLLLSVRHSRDYKDEPSSSAPWQAFYLVGYIT